MVAQHCECTSCQHKAHLQWFKFMFKYILPLKKREKKIEVCKPTLIDATMNFFNKTNPITRKDPFKGEM